MNRVILFFITPLSQLKSSFAEVDINETELPKISQVRIISKTQAKEMYQLMKDVHELFEKHQITYWVVGDTLLGAIRHYGIIPWDDDMDIGIDEKDISKFKALSYELNKLNYEINSGRLFFKIQAINGKLDSCEDGDNWSIKSRSPWLDVFSYKEEKDQYVHANETVRSW